MVERSLIATLAVAAGRNNGNGNQNLQRGLSGASASRDVRERGAAMVYMIGRFAVDEAAFVQTVPVRILVAAGQRWLDLNRLAREALANRVYDQGGVWVGFERANAALEAAQSHQHVS